MDRDLNDVRVFARVVEAGSFTAAARALGLPTSAVSRRVSRLEEVLGIRLLQRTTRQLSLTDAGRIYHACSTGVLAELEEAERRLAHLQSRPSGRVRMTAPVEDRVTIAVVTRFLAAFPDVRVELELTNRQVNLVEEGYDVALRAGPLADTSLFAQKVMDSAMRIVGSPAYFAERGRPRRVQDLQRHDAIVFGTTALNATWALTGARGLNKVPVRGRIAVNHFQAVRTAALAGLGLALLPTLFCAHDLKAGRLRSVLEPAVPPPIPVWIVYPGGRLITPAARALIEFSRQHLRPIVESGDF